MEHLSCNIDTSVAFRCGRMNIWAIYSLTCSTLFYGCFLFYFPLFSLSRPAFSLNIVSAAVCVRWTLNSASSLRCFAWAGALGFQSRLFLARFHLCAVFICFLRNESCGFRFVHSRCVPDVVSFFYDGRVCSEVSIFLWPRSSLVFPDSDFADTWGWFYAGMDPVGRARFSGHSIWLLFCHCGRPAGLLAMFARHAAFIVREGARLCRLSAWGPILLDHCGSYIGLFGSCPCSGLPPSRVDRVRVPRVAFISPLVLAP